MVRGYAQFHKIVFLYLVSRLFQYMYKGDLDRTGLVQYEEHALCGCLSMPQGPVMVREEGGEGVDAECVEENG